MYIGNSPQQTIRTDYTFIAIASQTLFTGVDNRGLVLSFNPNNYDVYANGILLARDEFVGPDGSYLQLITGRNAGDIITIRDYGFLDNFDITETVAYSRMPVGTFHWHMGTTAPSGSLIANGQAVSPLYPDLRNMIIALGSPWGTSSGDPLLPDMITTGYFVRAGGTGGLPIGTMQLDQMQGHHHLYEPSAGQRGVSSPSGTTDIVSGGGAADPKTNRVTGAITDGTNGTPRVGSETRPRNIAFLPCIKAFGTVDPEGMADLSALLNAIATEAQARAGTDNTQLMTPLRTAQAIDKLSIFTKEYVSTEQVMVVGGALTLAHGLGSVPKLLQARIVCKTAEANYAVGDEVVMSFPDDSSGAMSAGQLMPTATDIFIRMNSNLIVGAKTSGSRVVLTPANWRLIVRAWA